jgi:hypothetical protein
MNNCPGYRLLTPFSLVLSQLLARNALTRAKKFSSNPSSIAKTPSGFSLIVLLENIHQKVMIFVRIFILCYLEFGDF